MPASDAYFLLPNTFIPPSVPQAQYPHFSIMPQPLAWAAGLDPGAIPILPGVGLPGAVTLSHQKGLEGLSHSQVKEQDQKDQLPFLKLGFQWEGPEEGRS